MAQNVTIAGAAYSSVPAVSLPKTGGGTATFVDTSDATAGAGDMLSGKTAYIRNMQHLMQGLSGVSVASFRGFLAIFPAALFNLCRGLKTCVSSFSQFYHGFRGFWGYFRISFRNL